MHDLTFSISISFISWIVGMIVNAFIKNKPYYAQISNLNFIESDDLNKKIGLNYFKWIVKNSFFKYFNQKITLKNKRAELSAIRYEMTIAEISHLIGFGFVTLVALIKCINGHYVLTFIIMMVNIVMNLYPSLLQQENKRRIDNLIKN